MREIKSIWCTNKNSTPLCLGDYFGYGDDVQTRVIVEDAVATYKDPEKVAKYFSNSFMIRGRWKVFSANGIRWIFYSDDQEKYLQIYFER